MTPSQEQTLDQLIEDEIADSTVTTRPASPAAEVRRPAVAAAPDAIEVPPDPGLTIAAAEINPTPVEVVPAAPDTRPLAERLEDNRMAYFVAKAHFADMRKLKGLILNKESRAKIEEEFGLAQQKYTETRTEYVGASLEKFIEEREKYADADAARLTGGKNWIKQAYNGYKKLGEFNLIEQSAKLVGKDYKAKGRLAKMVNARTAISLALLGVSAGAGAATAVGMGAIAIRRGMSGAGMAVASYDLTMMAREKMFKRPVIEKGLAQAKTADQVAALMDQMRLRHGLNGKAAADLKKDSLYTNLSARYKELLAQEVYDPAQELALGPDDKKHLQEIQAAMRDIEAVASLNVTTSHELAAKLAAHPDYNNLDKERQKLMELHDYQILSRRMDRALAGADAVLEKTRKNEKLDRVVVGGASFALGALVGSGKLAELFGHKTALHADSTPAAASASPASAVHHDINLPATETPTVGLHPKFNIDFAHPDNHAGPSLKADFLHSTPDKPRLNASFLPKDFHAHHAPLAIPEHHVVEMRAGAVMETQGNEAIIHVGSRGIEGALLDLNQTPPHGDPEKYKLIMDHLHRTYQDFKGNDGALIDKFVRDYAAHHDMTVDGGGLDLSHISSADLHIGAHGELDLGAKGSLHFLPERLSTIGDHAASAASDAEVPPLDHFVHGFDPNEMHLATTALKSAPDLTPAQEMLHAREIASTVVKKASDALELVLGERTYRPFLKAKFKLTPKDFDKLGNVSLRRFVLDYQSGSESYKRRFQFLYNSLARPNLGSDKTIRQFVLAAAKESQKLI